MQNKNGGEGCYEWGEWKQTNDSKSKLNATGTGEEQQQQTEDKEPKPEVILSKEEKAAQFERELLEEMVRTLAQ